MQKFSRPPLFALFCGMSALSAVMFCGCVPPGHMKSAMADLQQENAAQRTRIFNDKWRLEEFRQENASLKRRIKTLEEQLSSREQIPNRMQQFTPSGGGKSDVSVRAQSEQKTYRASATPAGDTVPATPPTVEKGAPSVTAPPDMFPESPYFEELPVNPSAGSRAVIRVRKTDSSSVYRVRILKNTVRPSNYDGLFMNFQMLDDENQIVLAAGPVIVEVTDPSAPPESSLISRWLFSDEEIAEKINTGEASLSIPLGMAWERGCPVNLKLNARLRFVTSDGRQLMDEIAIDLENAAFTEPSTGLAAEMLPTNSHTGSHASEENFVPLQRPVWTPEAN